MAKLNVARGIGGKNKKPSSNGLLQLVGVRPASRRARLLNALVARRNRAVPVQLLVKEVYGRSPGGPGQLYMVAKGLTEKVKKARANVVLRKSRVDGNVTYGIFTK